MCFLILKLLHEHSGAFQIRLPLKYGNHEILLIRPVNNPLESLSTLPPNSDLNNHHSPLQQFNQKWKKGGVKLVRMRSQFLNKSSFHWRKQISATVEDEKTFLWRSCCCWCLDGRTTAWQRSNCQITPLDLTSWISPLIIGDMHSHWYASLHAQCFQGVSTDPRSLSQTVWQQLSW